MYEVEQVGEIDWSAGAVEISVEHMAFVPSDGRLALVDSARYPFKFGRPDDGGYPPVQPAVIRLYSRRRQCPTLMAAGMNASACRLSQKSVRLPSVALDAMTMRCGCWMGRTGGSWPAGGLEVGGPMTRLLVCMRLGLGCLHSLGTTKLSTNLLVPPVLLSTKRTREDCLEVVKQKSVIND